MADVLRSGLLETHGFAHGFSLRTGGVSAPPFDTLNVARNVGDAPAAVEENRLRLARAVGHAPEKLRETHQVHGAAVLYVDAGSTAAETRAVEADALLTRHEGLALGVRTADCVPLLLADVRTGAVAALHAGWRGLVAGIVPAALRAFATLCGNRPSEWIAAIGPHIRADAFEVADDVAGRIVAAVGEARALVRRPGRPHVDLAIAVRAQLLAAGMRSERIDDVGGCTFAESTRFFSYRRDGTRSGRHLSVIVARAADRNAS